MRWFRFGAEGAALSWKEWDKLVADPEDMMASIALGRKAYGDCLRLAGISPDQGAVGTITAFAHILHHTLDEMSEERWQLLRWDLQEVWKQEELGLWDPPETVMRNTGDGMLLDLLTVRNCLDRVARPEIYRLAWCCFISSGRDTHLRPVDSRMSKNGLSGPLMLLERLRRDGLPPFLDEEEKEGMAFLLSSLRLSDWAPSDEILDVLAGHRYALHANKVYLDYYVSGGRWEDRAEVARWKERCLKACAMLMAFRVMFLASVTGESGPLRVSLPD
ncbi:MAG: hypothetical protein NT131_08405 [Methanomassiliicoccales archaeon]|nr:hypothetical protein [Methanomassiliicoccales archaeon]